MNLYIAAQSLTGISTQTAHVLEQIAGVFFLAFLAWKALHLLATEQFGKLVGLCIIAIIPAMFIYDAAGAQQFLKSTVSSIGG